MAGHTTSILDAAATPWSAASHCMGKGVGTLLFEDQAPCGTRSSWSLLFSEPQCWLVERDGEYRQYPTDRAVRDPLEWMTSHHASIPPTPELPFVGGLAGMLGFEFGWSLDCIRRSVQTSGDPGMWVGVFPAAALYDHDRQRWVVAGRDEQSVQRLAMRVEEAPEVAQFGPGRGTLDKMAVDGTAYQSNVRSAVDAICSGALFEVNYTERFRGRWTGDRRALYDRLRQCAPGRYGGLVDTEQGLVASISPEQFLLIDGSGKVTARPIKGTRPRGATEAEDQRFADALRNSPKDRAENVMIVDLMRNDLTRVCEPGSVRVTELCGLHSFPSVHHLVSTIEGQLGSSFSALDCFLSAFPAGSITGAPKLRSMEWIAAHEMTPRGPYTGSMFYWSDHGRLDSNVLIRTAVLVGDDVEYGAGGAVVVDSDPQQEYEEARWKAKPFFEVMEGQ